MTLPGLAIDYRRRAILAFLAAALLGAAALAEGGKWALSTLAAARHDLEAAQTAIATASAGDREAETRKALSAELMAGASAAEAQAALQVAVKALAERHGAEIGALQPMPSSTLGGLTLTQLQMQAAMPEAQFPLFLEDLVASRPALLPSLLETSPQPQSPSADGTPTMRRVAVRIEIAAFSTTPALPAEAGQTGTAP